MKSEMSTEASRGAIQGTEPPASQEEFQKQLRIYQAKLKQRTDDLEMLKGIWNRLPWLWASLVTMIPLGIFLGVWGIFIGLGLALSLVGVGYYITYAHVSQHEMELKDIQRKLDLLKSSEPRWAQDAPINQGPKATPPASPILL